MACRHTDVDFIGYQRDGRGCRAFALYQCRACGTSCAGAAVAESRAHVPDDARLPGNMGEDTIPALPLGLIVVAMLILAVGAVAILWTL